MFYEEKIINGVLHFRNRPSAQFQPFTLEGLTIALKAEQKMREHYEEELEEARKTIKEIKQIIRDK